MPLKSAIPLLLLALIVGAFGQGALGLPHQLRFSSPAVNYWAFAAAAISFPFLAAWVALSLSRPWARRLSFVFAVLLAIPCLLMSSCAVLEAPQVRGGDASYELLSEVTNGAVTYRLYRTNCGATCAYGLDLRAERDLLFGAKLVSPLWSLYRASEGQVKVNGSKIQILNGANVLTELSL